MTTQCIHCRFALWVPITEFGVSRLGLYDDARFPGRCILSLRWHYEHLEDVPAVRRQAFMDDIATAASAIRKATDCARVNVAILGNAEPHVHAHLIPRFPLEEEFPDQAPWADLRAKTKNAPDMVEALVAGIRVELEGQMFNDRAREAVE